MKIGIISNLYPPYIRGGAEQVVVRTIEELTARGHDVFVITSMPWKKNKRIILNTNASERIYQFAPGNLYFTLDDHKKSWPTRLLWHIIDAFGLRSGGYVKEILADEGPDVVITHNLKGLGLRIPRVIQRMKIPHIHVVHDLQLIIPSGLKFAGKESYLLPTRIAYKVYQAVTKFMLRKPDAVIFPSNYLMKEYTSLGFFANSNIQMLPNPAPDFTVRTYRDRIDGPLILLFVGQLEDHKGINFLLNFYKDKNIKTNLIIAGEGALVKKVEKAADTDKRITYLGYIALDQLLNCFEIADALVVPSLCYENSPTVIYESLQAGIPVLASDIGGVGELVEHGKNGFLFRPGDQKDFRRILQLLVESRERFTHERDKIRDSVRPYALSEYCTQLVQIANDALNQKRK